MNAYETAAKINPDKVTLLKALEISLEIIQSVGAGHTPSNTDMAVAKRYVSIALQKHKEGLLK